MKRIYRNSLKALSWCAVIIAGWSFLGDWFAPDACLDFGGAFDYVHWHCSHDPNEVLSYIDVPVYQLASFQVFSAFLALAIVLQISLRAPRANA